MKEVRACWYIPPEGFRLMLHAVTNLYPCSIAMTERYTLVSVSTHHHHRVMSTAKHPYFLPYNALIASSLLRSITTQMQGSTVVWLVRVGVKYCGVVRHQQVRIFHLVPY